MKRDFHISYRPIRESDQKFLLELYDSTRNDLKENAHYLSSVQITAFIEMQFKAQDMHYKKFYPDADFLIIQAGKKDIGRLYIEEWPSQFRIIDITIAPKFRSLGIGEKIMKEVMKKAESKGKFVSIHVSKDNAALRLYNRLGFHIDGGTEVYHLMTTKKELCNEESS